MKLYHSSIQPVETPDTIHSREFLDFGKGFYLTSIRDQAEKYAQRFVRRQQQAWLNVYEFEFEPSAWKVLAFDSYNKEWLDFIANCRAGKDTTDYDIVIGGIANDKVIRTLDRFFAGELSVQQTLGLLQYEKPNIQYCIRSQQLIDNCLKHIESIRL
ncbi:MAG: DUF3990 domain-containing protein [Bacteroides sp.]|nr:DUF3990 domain-containing protein [Bacteroides sp.]MCM1086410.1 DUF3990 domain-containing protein [Bacteroides sp.]